MDELLTFTVGKLATSVATYIESEKENYNK